MIVFLILVPILLCIMLPILILFLGKLNSLPWLRIFLTLLIFQLLLTFSIVLNKRQQKLLQRYLILFAGKDVTTMAVSLGQEGGQFQFKEFKTKFKLQEMWGSL